VLRGIGMNLAAVRLRDLDGLGKFKNEVPYKYLVAFGALRHVAERAQRRVLLQLVPAVNQKSSATNSGDGKTLTFDAWRWVQRYAPEISLRITKPPRLAQTETTSNRSQCGLKPMNQPRRRLPP